MSLIINNGIVASPGIKIGKAYIYKGDKIPIPRYKIKDEEIVFELDRFNKALERTKEEIKSIQAQIAKNLSKEMSDIFSSHLMVLEDPIIEEKSRKIITEEKKNAEWVINDISIDLINSLSTIEDDYFRERIIDISDINKRVISNLQKNRTYSITDIKEEVIVFASDLTPSETAIMNKNLILAFVTDKGGKTSHTAIMARALEIPAIVGTLNASSLVKNDDTVIIDAVHGQIIINPTENEITEFRRYQEEFEQLELELAKLTNLPSQTVDNQEVFIFGNIEIPEEVEIIKNHGAQGIGLFRSEFLFLDKSLPDEERQFNEYRKVAEHFNPLPVTIRTIDVGGDKVYAYTKQYKERNPFLGCRAIRFSLENVDLFKIQLRAILRASHYGNIKLMFPMITTLEEFFKSKAITENIMDELRSKNIPFNENIEIGIMIEVPSAAINSDILGRHVDFFSVGTNDLVQYILAVDRISEKIAYLYNPLNIAVLRSLKQIVDASLKNSVPLSICGEIAGEPQYTMLLLGLGFRQLSMSPTYMNQVKKIIRSVNISECEEMVREIMGMELTEEIEALVRMKFKEKYQEIM
ncbi:MAG: phosphoenolpyruvate--protein phosphotransferase [Spirochaetes bacterium]|jgi:phosphotransferase system enzyme I (PtsI)|nr:phosphoenolpyruvate--protein phosphotransferase [Spirochaetota bacterium]